MPASMAWVARAPWSIPCTGFHTKQPESCAGPGRPTSLNLLGGKAGLRSIVRRTPKPIAHTARLLCSLAEHTAGVSNLDVSSTSGAQSDSEVELEVREADNFDGIVEWELDFCSRPILDERGKRVWELLVCDSSRRLQHTEYFPSNRINSATLRDALLRIIQERGAPRPQKVRFFRAQMQNIISKACAELDIRPVPSQRCVTLVQWLEERYTDVYTQHPGFQEGATPLLQLDPPPPEDLPDNLRGEQWAFVQLPLSGVLEEMERVNEGSIFGSVLTLEALGLDPAAGDIMIPGVAVASSRATPLAAWTNALELAGIQVEQQRACLILTTGVADRWRYAFYRRSRQADQEAAAWEEAKKACGGLHFLAVQRDLEAEECSGFWLLRDVPTPQV
eukprot:jgi/Mesen1/4463/ME000227S03477